MKLDFNDIPEEVLPHFKGGEKEYVARMFWDGSTRIMRGRLDPGASIGLHRHDGTSEAIYVLSGRGTATCDGVPEPLSPGDCHFCPEGREHTLVNDGVEPLVFFAVVPTVKQSRLDTVKRRSRRAAGRGAGGFKRPRPTACKSSRRRRREVPRRREG